MKFLESISKLFRKQTPKKNKRIYVQIEGLAVSGNREVMFFDDLRSLFYFMDDAYYYITSDDKSVYVLGESYLCLYNGENVTQELVLLEREDNNDS